MRNVVLAIFSVILLIAHADCLEAAHFTGDGGRGIRIAVMAPDAVGLPAEQDYLPTLVQGVLAGDFARFSAMAVQDRQRIETILEEHERNVHQTTEDFLRRLAEIADVDYLLTGSITRTVTGHALQLQVVGMREGNIGRIRASFSGNPTVAEMDNFTGIRRASYGLLTQIGVNLTAGARQQLAGAVSQQSINAQIYLAQGIVAQRGGTVIEALSRYLQAATQDPTLTEAVSRLNVLSANISSGNIREDVRNEIRWRDEWIAVLNETNALFERWTRESPPPFTLTYSTDIRQGDINFANRTVSLSGITLNLHAEHSWFGPINQILETVFNGLHATGRAEAWGLYWPFTNRHLHSFIPLFRPVFQVYEVTVEVINDEGARIGRRSIRITYSWAVHRKESFHPRHIIEGFEIFPTSTSISGHRRPFESGRFVRWDIVIPNVNPDRITDRLSVRISSINGMPAEQFAAQRGISIMTQDEFETYGRFRFAGGEIQGFARQPQIRQGHALVSLNIPDAIWGTPVTSIGQGAFRDIPIREITIPDGITSIGAGAFRNVGLTNVTIPDGVIYIGDNAFANNSITSVTIPDSVIHIGFMAFDARVRITRSAARMFQFAGGEIQGFYNAIPANLVIPDTILGTPVTSIGAGAFRNAELTSVAIPDSVIYIGAEAFLGNNSLERITIGANVTMSPNSFGGGGFRAFPDSYNRNGRQAGTYNRSEFLFYRGEIQGFVRQPQLGQGRALPSLNIPNAIWGNPVTSIGRGAFRGIPIREITIPGSVTSIGEAAFLLEHPPGIEPGMFRFFPQRITIGANVRMAENSFRQVIQRGDVRHFYVYFERYYNRNNRRAGTYIFPNETRRNVRWNWVTP